jgi:hypothetical protein
VTSGCLARQEIGRRRRIQIITVVAPATPACEGRDDVAVLRAARRTALVGGLVLCAAVGPLAGPGRADALQPPAVSASWYWAERAPLVAGMQAPTLPEQAAMAADVPAGDLGVGYVNSNLAPADKVAAVGFDLTAIAMGSTFSRFTVTVPVDAGATQVQTAQPDLVACENIDAFVDGTAGGPLAEAPPVSDPSCVKGVFDAGKGYVFDLTTMANDWSFGAPSLGITLKPLTPSTTTPLFSVVLKGKNSITTQAAFTGPAPAQQAPDPAAGGAVPPAPPAGGGALSPSLPVAGLVPAAAPVADAPIPQTAPLQPLPQVDVAPQPAPVRVRAAAYVPPSGGPTSAFWLALLLGAGVLGVTAVVFGDPMAPAPADARRARFADVVQAGRRTP